MRESGLNGDPHTGKPNAFFSEIQRKKFLLQNSVLSAHYAICLHFPPPEQHTAVMRLVLKPFQ